MAFNWDNHPFLKWIRENSEKTIGWIIAIIVTNSLGLIVAYVFTKYDYPAQILALILLSVIGIIVLIALYYAARFKELNELSGNLGHSVSYFRQVLCDGGHLAHDVSLNNVSKIIVFDKISLEKDGNTRVENKWEIQNNMNESYNKFYFWLQSSSYVPPFEDFKFYRENIETPIDKFTSKFEHIEHHVGDPGSTQRKITKVEDTMYLPVQVPKKASCKVELHYRTNAYKEAFHGNKDFISKRISRITEKLYIEIRLDEEIKNSYKISKVRQYRQGSLENYEFEIQDESRVRMRISEDELKTKPEFNEDKLLWVVYNPKVGYSYKVFFTLIKK